MPIISPGTTPAMNKPAIETLPMAPYTTAVILGGTSAAMVEAEAMIAAMKADSYPSFRIGPPSARLITATSAVVEPDISEKNIENTTTTCDNPPLICPTSDTERLAIRTTTLAELMSSPTRRKNGIASSASESTPSKIFCTIAASETSARTAPTNTPAISENGTGTPRYPKNRKQNDISARMTGGLTGALPSRGWSGPAGSRDHPPPVVRE